MGWRHVSAAPMLGRANRWLALSMCAALILASGQLGAVAQAQQEQQPQTGGNGQGGRPAPAQLPAAGPGAPQPGAGGEAVAPAASQGTGQLASAQGQEQQEVQEGGQAVQAQAGPSEQGGVGEQGAPKRPPVGFLRTYGIMPRRGAWQQQLRRTRLCRHTVPA
jgi:hypothetical protein